MKNRTNLGTTGLIAIASIVLIAAQGTALARGGGGGGGHAALGGGHFGGGFARGGFRGGYGGHGGHGRGHGRYGGYGGHGYGGYGYGGYGYGGYGGWGWGWGGLGYGLFLSTLPFYYSTLWWDGIPYYYADNDYYAWNGNVDEYQQVQPPPQVVQEAGTQAPTVTELYAYPMKGQTPQQQTTDKSECRSWAMGQTGAHPVTPANNAAPTIPGPPAASGALLGTINGSTAPASTPAAEDHGDYLRAEAACLKARGYSVE